MTILNRENMRSQPAALLLFLLLLSGFVYSIADPSITTSTDPSFIRECLTVHNQIRAVHSAAPVSWDAHLASVAQEYSSTCPQPHSSPPGMGENIGWGLSATDALNRMYDERRLYDWSNPQWAKETGRFSAIVWRNTSRVGCALTHCTAVWAARGFSAELPYELVCEYSPKGNIQGRFPENVVPECEGGTPLLHLTFKQASGSAPDKNQGFGGFVSAAPRATARSWIVTAVVVMQIWAFAYAVGLLVRWVSEIASEYLYVPGN